MRFEKYRAGEMTYTNKLWRSSLSKIKSEIKMENYPEQIDDLNVSFPNLLHAHRSPICTMSPIISTIHPGENELPYDINSTSPSLQPAAEQSNIPDSVSSRADGSPTLPNLEDPGTKQSQRGLDIPNELYREKLEWSQSDFETASIQDDLSHTGNNIPSYIEIPGKSPTASEFGYEQRKEWNIEILPNMIQDYMEENKLEAYFVKPDGNCLFRAVSFHPKFNKALLSRQGAAGYIEGGKQTENALFDMVTDDQLRKIQTRTNHA